MLRDYIPESKQWTKWSLPSKYSIIGCGVGLAAIFITIILWWYPRQTTPDNSGIPAFVLIAPPGESAPSPIGRRLSSVKNGTEVSEPFEDGSVLLWFKFIQVNPQAERYLFSYINYYDSNFMEIVATSDSSLEFRIYDSRNKKYLVQYNHFSRFDSWTCVAVTWKSKVGIDLYINGNIKSHADAPSADFKVPVRDFYIGEHPKLSTIPLGGAIARIALYRAALSLQKLRAIYEACRAEDNDLEMGTDGSPIEGETADR